MAVLATALLAEVGTGIGRWLSRLLWAWLAPLGGL